MITKIRTNIFLTRVQQKELKTLAKKTGGSVAALVGMAIDEYLKKKGKNHEVCNNFNSGVNHYPLGGFTSPHHPTTGKASLREMYLSPHEVCTEAMRSFGE